MMAAADRIEITIEGKGGHGGMPQFVCDPVGSRACDHGDSVDRPRATSIQPIPW